VRNPYERLISAYNTQVGNTWNREYAWLKQDIKQTFNYRESEESRELLIPFRDFVCYLRDTTDDVQRDGHFNVQTRVLMPDLINYNFVGRFEQFSTDFTTVLKQLGASPSVLASATEVINPSVKIQSPLAYDKSLADMVYEMYHLDFENYGYDRNSWMFERT
jgi:hypothetical protein